MGTILRRLAAAGFLLSLAVPLGACGGSSTGSNSGPLDVVAGFYPLRFVVEQVGGVRVQVRDLTPAGAEPHDLELSARDLVRLREADLVVYLHGFSPAVDEAIAVAARRHAFDVTSAARLMTVGPTVDPHFWLDLQRLGDVANAVADELTRLDPAHADEYRNGVFHLLRRTTMLDGAYRSELANCAAKELVTSHTAFGYLASKYGFEQVGVSGIEADREPTPTDLARVADFVKANDVTTIYTETLVSPATARTVADATGAQIAVLDPIEGLEADSKDDYFGIMEANLAVLKKGQKCS